MKFAAKTMFWLKYNLAKLLGICIILTFTLLDLSAHNLKTEKESSASMESNKLLFMIGTWQTSGTQFWYDGTWVEHKGIVEAKLLEDGVTIERTFWASFSNGASLGGRSLHIYNPEENTWSSRWVPTAGNWNASDALGKMTGKEYFEEAIGSDAKGKFTSKTRFFDISPTEYKVSTDLTYESGEVSKNNWNIHFKKIHGLILKAHTNIREPLDFMLGNWVAEGTMKLQDGSQARHKSFVEGHLSDKKEVLREFWGSINVGGALKGVSTHTPRKENNQWDSKWNPVAGAPGPIALGKFEEEQFIEEYSQETPNGTTVVRTKYFDISDAGYSVQTDLILPNGEVNEAVWTVRFKRIS